MKYASFSLWIEKLSRTPRRFDMTTSTGVRKDFYSRVVLLQIL